AAQNIKRRLELRRGAMAPAVDRAALLLELLRRIDQRDVRPAENELHVRTKAPDGRRDLYHRRELRRRRGDADGGILTSDQIILQRREEVFDAREVEQIDVIVLRLEAGGDLQHA